jgi:hypothetical protein
MSTISRDYFMRAGPIAAKKILDVARREFPMSKSVYLLMAQEEVAFWQALRQGCVTAARARAAALCALPHHAGSIEMELRCALPEQSHS